MSYRHFRYCWRIQSGQHVLHNSPAVSFPGRIYTWHHVLSLTIRAQACIILLTGQFVTDQSVKSRGGMDVQELSRREREKLNRRNEILQAAWEVFASKDYDSATVDEIAEAAELSKGTLYLYFQNKADLFFSTLEMGIERVFSIVHEVVSSHDDPVNGLKEIIKRLLNFFEENEGFFKILFSERSHFELRAEVEEIREFKKRMMDMASDGFKVISDYVQHGIDMGVLRQVDPGDVAFLLMEIIRGFAFAMMHGPVNLRPSGKAESISSILLDGIRERK